jgi:hypothetical protein
MAMPASPIKIANYVYFILIESKGITIVENSSKSQPIANNV